MSLKGGVGLRWGSDGHERRDHIQANHLSLLLFLISQGPQVSPSSHTHYHPSERQHHPLISVSRGSHDPPLVCELPGGSVGTGTRVHVHSGSSGGVGCVRDSTGQWGLLSIHPALNSREDALRETRNFRQNQNSHHRKTSTPNCQGRRESNVFV